MLDVFLDALIDSLKLLPMLYLIYLLVEYLLHKKRETFLKKVSTSNKASVLIGTGLGIIPQCGFSTAMADFYSKKYISLGTLFAIFLATSDEAIILMFADYKLIPSLLLLIVLKAIIAICVGYLIDFVLRKKMKTKIDEKEIENAVKNNINAECDHEHIVEHEHKHHNEHRTSKDCDCCTSHIFVHALKHTMEIFLFVFIANIIVGSIVEFSNLSSFIEKVISSGTVLEPIICSLIGIIPNCFASVLLVQFYSQGIINFASLLGGLCSGAGVGILILFKQNKNIKENILIVISLIVIGIIIGMFGLLF